MCYEKELEQLEYTWNVYSDMTEWYGIIDIECRWEDDLWILPSELSK